MKKKKEVGGVGFFPYLDTCTMIPSTLLTITKYHEKPLNPTKHPEPLTDKLYEHKTHINPQKQLEHPTEIYETPLTPKPTKITKTHHYPQKTIKC